MYTLTVPHCTAWCVSMCVCVCLCCLLRAAAGAGVGRSLGGSAGGVPCTWRPGYCFCAAGCWAACGDLHHLQQEHQKAQVRGSGPHNSAKEVQDASLYCFFALLLLSCKLISDGQCTACVVGSAVPPTTVHNEHHTTPEVTCPIHSYQPLTWPVHGPPLPSSLCMPPPPLPYCHSRLCLPAPPPRPSTCAAWPSSSRPYSSSSTAQLDKPSRPA